MYIIFSLVHKKSVHFQEVDMLAGALVVSEERKNAIEFTLPFLTTAIGMLIRSPDHYIDDPFLIVTAPLDWKVWSMIALFIVVSGFVFKGVIEGLKKLGQEIDFSLSDSVITFYR